MGRNKANKVTHRTRTGKDRAAFYRKIEGIKRAIAKVFQCIRNVNFEIDSRVGEPNESSGYIQMQSIAKNTPRGQVKMEQYFRNILLNAERALMSRQQVLVTMRDQGGGGGGGFILFGF